MLTIKDLLYENILYYTNTKYRQPILFFNIAKAMELNIVNLNFFN